MIYNKNWKRKGKTYAELVGTKKAKLWKKKQRLAQLGDKNHMWHKHHTEEAKKRIGLKSIGRKTMLGKHLSEEAKRKLSKFHKGLYLTKETKNKLSKISKSFWKNPKYLKKMEKRNKKTSQLLKGRKLSKKTKEKIRLSTIKAYQRGCYHITPNIPERQIIQICKLNNLPFNYIGDGKVWFNRFNPDFLSKNPKYIIEIYGEYHHNLLINKIKHKRRLKAYSSLGYKTLIIWSKELKNPQRVTEKIIDFLYD